MRKPITATAASLRLLWKCRGRGAARSGVAPEPQLLFEEGRPVIEWFRIALRALDQFLLFFTIRDLYVQDQRVLDQQINDRSFVQLAEATADIVDEMTVSVNFL